MNPAGGRGRLKGHRLDEIKERKKHEEEEESRRMSRKKKSIERGDEVKVEGNEGEGVLKGSQE